jgi:ectoine hydroxylase-related dioxygenase (phytanoyl-CoA dioxygenase family)
MQKHNPLPRPSSLSEDDLKTFRRDGVVCLRGILSSEEIEGLRSGVDTQLANFGKSETGYDFESIANQVWADDEIIDVNTASRFEMSELRMVLDYDKSVRPIRDEVSCAAKGDGMFFYDAAGWRFHSGIRKAALDSALPALVTQLLETERTNFWEDTTFVKLPETPQRTTFHQDYAYFQISGSQCCIVWIALDDADLENGTMEYVRGSHRWEEVYAPNVFISQSPHPLSPYERMPDIEANRDDYDIVSFDVKPGDVIIHHVMTIHGAGGNASSDRMRRAISFRYCGDDIQYCDRSGAIVQPYLVEQPEEEAALYGKDYPLVWPRPFPGANIASVFDGIDLKGPLRPDDRFDATEAPTLAVEERVTNPLVSEGRDQEGAWNFDRQKFRRDDLAYDR